VILALVKAEKQRTEIIVAMHTNEANRVSLPRPFKMREKTRTDADRITRTAALLGISVKSAIITVAVMPEISIGRFILCYLFGISLQAR
jgi:hypothetical protein